MKNLKNRHLIGSFLMLFAYVQLSCADYGKIEIRKNLSEKQGQIAYSHEKTTTNLCPKHQV